MTHADTAHSQPVPAQPGEAAVRNTAGRVAKAHRRVMEQMGRVIIGQRDVADLLLLGLLCRGHCILEGVAGVAKTLIISNLAKLLGLKFGRIQFTPDLMPIAMMSARSASPCCAIASCRTSPRKARMSRPTT